METKGADADEVEELLRKALEGALRATGVRHWGWNSQTDGGKWSGKIDGYDMMLKSRTLTLEQKI